MDFWTLAIGIGIGVFCGITFIAGTFWGGGMEKAALKAAKGALKD